MYQPANRKYGLEDISEVAAANLSANIVSTLQAGCFFGALVASVVADKWGRKLGLITASVLAIIGVIMQVAASGHLEAMYIGRYANSPSPAIHTSPPVVLSVVANRDTSHV